MTARKLNQVLWDQWRQQVKRQRESRLSIAEFCRRESISPHSFHAWKRKLCEAGSVRRMSTPAPAVKRKRPTWA